ncbi:granzyme H [Homo sapiens]|uniref:Isoform 2 of Granzyme H n=1 Tax=Homo sapiens TaxID=9606 RepID=P20718-2|nr:granzyme H isoform 3 precursor [Homo sapiens]AAP70247.1 granzyme H splice variant 2 [Homo sapiens]EAW66004.1 granzyme H (cathepsin G-like 2, protein h-CCPX), isoform CRA_a [Homo sapiens]KAI2570795.1 granzyme H [Homo sapiens]KAI4060428.1 granzyme H [Homo sapiens]|eukprot:NP_001257710.1 granzyme H isoform 3 precursor [Homo sapiens]
MQPFLLLLAFLLTPGAGTEEIIGGHEAKPHSRPYMAFVQFLQEKSRKRCGGILVRKDFVLTAAHCQGSSINVTLGAHNIKEQERTQQFIPVKRPIPHPAYNPKNFSNDIMLLQGDSGGPLVCKDVAQGILSYGNKKGTPPGVYIKVSHFLPWIKRTMKRL